MLRLLAGIAAGCIYVAGSVMLVTNEGKAYRSTLSSALAITEPVEASLPVAAEPVPTAKAALPVPIKPAEHSDPKPVPKPTPTAVAVNKSIPPRPAAISVPAAVAHIPSAPKRSAPEAGTILGDERAAKRWDLSRLTLDDDRQIGNDLNRVILQLHRIELAGAYQRRVEEVADRLCTKFGTKPLKVTILDSDEVNAFSHPGGYLYVSRGLLNFIGEDEEYALEFVIGHELAHLELQHAYKCLASLEARMKREVKGPQSLGTVQALYTLIIPLGYLVDDSVNQDFEADEWIYHKMRQLLKRSHRESLTFLNKFVSYAKNHGFENGRQRPSDNKQLSLVENHYRSHAAAWKRLAKLKALNASAVPPK